MNDKIDFIANSIKEAPQRNPDMDLGDLGDLMGRLIAKYHGHEDMMEFLEGFSHGASIEKGTHDIQGDDLWQVIIAVDNGQPVQYYAPNGEWRDSNASIGAIIYNVRGGASRYRIKPTEQ
jgi:hypothetical protein